MKISSSDDNPEVIPISPFLTDQPPEPVSAEQYQLYLIGKHVEERNRYLPIGMLWPSVFDSYRKAKHFLDAHAEIRTRKPSPQRLEVHAGDWYKHLGDRARVPEPNEKQVEALMDEIDKRKKEVDRRRK